MQILSISIAIVLLFVFIAPIFSGVHNLGMAAGILLGLCFGAEGIFYDKMNFTTKKYTVFALFAISLALVLACAYVMSFGKNNTSHQKTVIILGCRVKGDVPSVALRKRADEAYFYLLHVYLRTHPGIGYAVSYHFLWAGGGIPDPDGSFCLRHFLLPFLDLPKNGPFMDYGASDTVLCLSAPCCQYVLLQCEGCAFFCNHSALDSAGDLLRIRLS